jgi:hypothetical protein
VASEEGEGDKGAGGVIVSKGRVSIEVRACHTHVLCVSVDNVCKQLPILPVSGTPNFLSLSGSFT